VVASRVPLLQAAGYLLADAAVIGKSGSGGSSPLMAREGRDWGGGTCEGRGGEPVARRR
jgi:hypothetical protein